MNSPQLSSDSLPVRVGDVLAGKYRVERVLGTGGMGFVVAARIVDLGKLVALKMMLPAALSMPRAVERFEREARASVQLKSEHIAEVLDIGRLVTGEPYIVMELLEGSDFEGLLQRERWLPVEDAVDYVLQACEAVSEAHALGVVHRDLKPKNLFLSHRLDGTPIVKVLDFGISKWTTDDSDSHSLTKTTDVFGSPNYMSPEQIRSARDVDGRTDIWSLGVILFELLTGRVPFVAVSLPQLCALVLETPAPSVSTLRADVPPGLATIVGRCLEKPCDQRFQSVRDLVTALLPFGRVRPQLRTSSGNLSPSASTIAMAAPLFRPPPTASSAGGPHVISNTSASWAGTPLAQKRGRHALIAAIVIPTVMLAIGMGGWVAWHWRGSLAHPPQVDASTTSTSASLPATTDPPPASASAPEAPTTPPPSASVTPEVKATATGRRPLVPPPAAVRDSGVTRPPPVTPTTASPTDPFTPVDRK